MNFGVYGDYGDYEICISYTPTFISLGRTVNFGVNGVYKIHIWFHPLTPFTPKFRINLAQIGVACISLYLVDPVDPVDPKIHNLAQIGVIFSKPGASTC